MGPGTSYSSDGRPSDSTDEHALAVNVEGAVVRDGPYLLVERVAEEEHAGGLLAFPGGKV
ncbi:hypothetical protein ACFQS5_12840 [Salinirubellus sp. GCM10025899]|uniref:hypothetical protein n=1 Tax=Salinirubellus sp. GCM10025899 TaxID=3252689 RepID=UPI003623EEC8